MYTYKIFRIMEQLILSSSHFCNILEYLGLKKYIYYQRKIQMLSVFKCIFGGPEFSFTDTSIKQIISPMVVLVVAAVFTELLLFSRNFSMHFRCA